MVKDLVSLNELYSTVQLSEPLETFKHNMDIVINLMETSVKAITEKPDRILESIKMYERWQKEAVESITESTEKIKKGKEDLAKFIKKGEDNAEYFTPELLAEHAKLVVDGNKLITDREKLLSDQEKHLEGLDPLQRKEKERWRLSVDSAKLELPSFMQMAFIYIVTIWDAFILDTVRTILCIHPELISKSPDKPELTKSDLWSLATAVELRESLIELEVRRLDGDRKKLVEIFNDYWGIDWSKSNVPMEIIIEIRARRDIWVHNQGIVNNQYLNMLNIQSSLTLGEVAEINNEYFYKSLIKLITLAVYVHRIADEKHYSKSS